MILASTGGGALDVGEVILGHVANHPWPFLGLSKHVLMMLIAAVVVILFARAAARGYDEDGVPRSLAAKMLDPFVEHFYRDIALAHVGEEYARKVTPLLLNFFFFILACNLLGLVPFFETIAAACRLLGVDVPVVFTVVHGGTTATGNYNVTMTLAIITFFSIILYGSLKFGVLKHFSHLAPPGIAWPVRFGMLVPIEILSMFVKPFALTMRLAANMTAGHMGLLALLMMPMIVHHVAVGVPSVALAIGISLLEIIVCFVQAYVFALLSGVFIGMALHPHH